jgi:Cu+-exporting ATPase
VYSVNFGAEQAAVSYDSSKTDVAALQKAVDEAGYSALPIQDDVLAPEDDVERRERQAENQKLTCRVCMSSLIGAL